MRRYDKIILNLLVDKYEKSKSFIGGNLINQSFSVKIIDVFPKYGDDSEFEIFRDINNAIADLINNDLVICKKKSNGVIISVALKIVNIDKAYDFLERVPKRDVNVKLVEILGRYRGYNELLTRFCDEQISRLEKNKKVKHFESFESFESVLKVLAEIFCVETETFEREFSLKVLGDSKAFGKIKSKVISILYEYGDFPDSETILQELNIINNPGHIYFKGAGKITIGNQVIDFNEFDGDFAVSSPLLLEVSKIEVTGESVITIENLTTFNSYKNKDAFIIYLGGYHNSNRRLFIKKLYEQNPNKQYFHYGDIDAGGFYILLHLRDKTKVNFKALNMDIETLKNNKLYTKRLTDNDRKRLRNLLDSEFGNTVLYMLENDCKLEQEAIE